MNRGALCTLIRNFLGTSDDDPAFTNTILAPLVQIANDGLVQDILDTNPAFGVGTTTLTTSATSHDYAIDTGLGFAGWVEVRHTDKDGILFEESRYEDLNRAPAQRFAITGPDETAGLTTSDATEVGINLYLRYRTWGITFASDNDTPTIIPTHFHDVIAFKTAEMGFGLGGEQRLPSELASAGQDRYAQLLQHVGRRGPQVGTVRYDPLKGMDDA